jgi:FKBP-type peptidyl-prolyl cis-trans isomerase SlyD
VEEDSHEVPYVHGYGVLLPALEDALEGKRAGEHCRITLPADEAFGPRREEAVLECDPEEFPRDVAVGDHLEAETEAGGLIVLRVLEVRPDAVVVDTNHPLAGQRVSFEVDVLEVRPATAAELARAEAQFAAAGTGGEPLIPLGSLLRGPSRRYEREPSGATEPEAGPAATDEEET